MKITRRELLGGAIAGTTLAISLARSAYESNRPIHLLAAINTSLSDRPNLPASIVALCDAYRHLRRGSDALTAYRVDDRTLTFHQGKVLYTPQQFEKLLVAQVRDVSPRDNTLTQRLWEAIKREAEGDTRPILTAVWSDGFSEGTDAAGHRAIRDAAAGIAANTHIAGVAILGPAIETWSELEEDLAPLRQRLGRDRFIIQVSRDAAPVAALIAAARATYR